MITSQLTYATLLLLSGFVCLSVIFVAWRKRNAPGAMALIVMMGGTAIWAVTYAIYWMFPNETAPFFWLDATYLGAVISPTAFFIFAIQFNRQAKWLNRRTIWILTIIPFLTILLLWTDQYHDLFFAGKRLVTDTDIFDGGPWFWVNIIYSYCLILLGYFFVFQGYFRQEGIYRKQSLLIILGSVIAPLMNIVGLFNISPFPGLDLTPFSFTVLSIFYTFGLVRLSIFDIVPVAKEILLNTMKDGMIIIDRYGRVVDLNQTAVNDLKLIRESIIGTDAVKIFSVWEELLSVWKDRRQEGGQFRIQVTGDRTLTVHVSRLIEDRPALKGWLVSWSDITDLVAVEHRLQRANQQLETRIREIENLQANLKEQIIRDPLTGLLNRRFLEESLVKEIARADRKKYEIVIFMIDIDSFKLINDSYGHPTGDKMLKQLAECLLSASRKEDFVIRMGGEEFLILMSDVSIENGLTRAEAIRAAVDAYDFNDGERSYHLTVSIGVSIYTESSSSIQDIIQKADHALYQAKASGKNCVAVDA